MKTDRIEILGGRYDGLRGERLISRPLEDSRDDSSVSIKGEDGKLYVIRRDEFEGLKWLV